MSFAAHKLAAVPRELPDPPYPADVRAKGWRFEIEPERVANSDTWDLADKELRPWLLMLWFVAWRQSPCGSLPCEDELIAAKIGMAPRTFNAARDVLLRGWWLASDGRLYHPVLTELVERMRDGRKVERDKKKRQRDAAKEAAKLSRGTPGGLPGESQRSPATGTGTGTGIPPFPPQGGPEGFTTFWNAWPAGNRKIAQDRAHAEWEAQGCDGELQAVLAGLEQAKVSPQWQREGGRFIPKPWKWLQERAWTAFSGPEADWRASLPSMIAKGVELGLPEWSEAAWAAGRVKSWPEHLAAIERRLAERS